jgi:hypothetical protein
MAATVGARLTGPLKTVTVAVLLVPPGPVQLSE